MSFKEDLSKLDARALISAVVIIGMFVEMPIVMLFAFKFLPQDQALELIRWTFMLLIGQSGYILGYYFGSRNNEKRAELNTKFYNAFITRVKSEITEEIKSELRKAGINVR